MKAKPVLRLPDLQELLAYEHEELIARFTKEFGFSKRFSKQVFKDVLRYLWVAAWGDLQATPYPNVMFAEVMDEMWHTFLLFTDDYRRFCDRYFGVFMNHNPALTLRARKPLDERNADSQLAVEATWKALGPATARRWYSEYPEKYPLHVLRERQSRRAHDRWKQRMAA